MDYNINMEATQTEKAYQKQASVAYNNKKGAAVKKRYVRPVGLGFKTPREAETGSYVDKKCPFTGNVRIRYANLVKNSPQNGFKRIFYL